MRTDFFIPMIPPTVTHQEKDITFRKGKDGKPKPVVYEPAELKAVRVKLRDHLAKHIPTEKYTGAVWMLTKWCFPITGKHIDGEYKITKPDTDNLQKLLKDVMTGLGFWHDDAQVASEITEKFWAKKPGIYIAIENLQDLLLQFLPSKRIIAAWMAASWVTNSNSSPVPIFVNHA